MKKHIILTLLLLFPLISNANSSRSSGGQREYMQQRAAYLKECFAKVDKQALQKLGQKAEAVRAEIQQLCENNKKSEATVKALEFGQKLSQDQNVKAARTCSDIFEKQLIPLDFYVNKTALEGSRICSDYKH